MKVISIIVALLLRLLPIAVALGAAYLSSDPVDQPFNRTTILLSTILGFIITIWATQQHIFRSIKLFEKSTPAYIEIFPTPKDKLEKVKSLYNVSDAVIYATHINDIGPPPFGKKDIAYNLYSSPKANNTFIRIVSANNANDRKWIKEMHECNKNPHYDLRVIENVPETLNFQNLVLVETKNDKKVFVSYRSDTSDGNYAFSTLNESYTKGVKGYLSKFSREATKAELAIENWNKSEKNPNN